jgi:hypothetical protein
MHPPFHITGHPSIDWIVFILLIVGALKCLYWLRALGLARQGARFYLFNLLKALNVLLVSIAVLAMMRMPTSLIQPIAALVALAFFGWLHNRKRSRYIPKSIKRSVIARDLKDEEYDPEKHHIDHVWPFSKGGSHTTDNLRVIAKKKNLRKGAKRPKMREMW